MTAVSHQMMTSVGPVTGAASGKRKHEPIAVTMVIDQATPKLNQAAVTKEDAAAAKIGFWRPSADGTEVQYTTIALTNALIIDVALSTHESHDPTPTNGFEYEEIKLPIKRSNGSGTTAASRGGLHLRTVRASVTLLLCSPCAQRHEAYQGGRHDQENDEGRYRS